MKTAHKPRLIMDSAFLDSLQTLDLYIRKAMNGRFGGTRRAPVYGSSAEFADYREYVPGDDLRRIDWNLFGRYDKYYIKQFIDERQLRIAVYIDMSASMDAGEGDKGLMTLRIAAAMGYLAVSNLDQCVFRLLSQSKCEDMCGVIQGREALYGAVNQLSTVTFSGSLDLEKAILADPDPGSGNGLSIIISDFLTDSNWKGAVDYLLNRHREVALVQVMTPEEMDPICSGRLHLQDMEAPYAEDAANMRVEVDRNVLWAYRQAVAAMQEDIAHFCQTRAVPYLFVRSDESIENVFLNSGMNAGLIR